MRKIKYLVIRTTQPVIRTIGIIPPQNNQINPYPSNGYLNGYPTSFPNGNPSSNTNGPYPTLPQTAYPDSNQTNSQPVYGQNNAAFSHNDLPVYSTNQPTNTQYTDFTIGPATDNRNQVQ